MAQGKLFEAQLYLIPFLHQTTTLLIKTFSVLSCILFHFYIKPQPTQWENNNPNVVSYSISTSNHNMSEQMYDRKELYLIPFLHQTTTIPFSLQNSKGLYLIPFLHQTTTGKANERRIYSCILFHFYIKPQRVRLQFVATCRCILFHFYIKPQRRNIAQFGRKSCILFHFYIKPQQSKSNNL